MPERGNRGNHRGAHSNVLRGREEGERRNNPSINNTLVGQTSRNFLNFSTFPQTSASLSAISTVFAVFESTATTT